MHSYGPYVHANATKMNIKTDGLFIRYERVKKPGMVR